MRQKRHDNQNAACDPGLDPGPRGKIAIKELSGQLEKFEYELQIMK